MSHKKFGPDRFSRFDVYWIQTNRQTDKPNLYIDCSDKKNIKKDIMKYQLCTNASKNYLWLLVVLNDLFGIKLIFYDPSWMLQLSEFVRTRCSSLQHESILAIKSAYFRRKPIPPFIFREHSLKAFSKFVYSTYNAIINVQKNDTFLWWL